MPDIVSSIIRVLFACVCVCTCRDLRKHICTMIYEVLCEVCREEGINASNSPTKSLQGRFLVRYRLCGGVDIFKIRLL